MSNANGQAVGDKSIDPAAAAELAELRAKRAELAARRVKREDARAPQETLARERLALEDDEVIERFESERGPDGVDIRVVRTPGGVIILKRAGAASFKRWMDRNLSRDGAKTEDHERLVRPCVLHPPMARFDELVEKYTMTWVRLTGALGLLAGHRTEELEEK